MPRSNSALLHCVAISFSLLGSTCWASPLPSDAAAKQPPQPALATIPSPALPAEIGQVAQLSADPALQQLQQENLELRQRIQRLEQLLNVSAPSPGQAEKPAAIVAKSGVYVEGSLGGQYRDLAGENGYTVTSFQPGFYGSAGLGYRFSKNFRFAAEYANLSSNVNTVAACYFPASPTGGGCGATPIDGVFFPGQGAIVLNQYTLNAYYDLDGFGPRQRFRPYVGLGVGTQKSSIINLSNNQAAPFGLFAYGTAWAPLITFSGGLSYAVNNRSEVFMGGKYALGSELLFNNTAFGDLLPQSSRNWVINGGFRYTF